LNPPEPPVLQPGEPTPPKRKRELCEVSQSTLTEPSLAKDLTYDFNHAFLKVWQTTSNFKLWNESTEVDIISLAA
jgi:hypothetical protein